jgi:hypothetical protein
MNVGRVMRKEKKSELRQWHQQKKIVCFLKAEITISPGYLVQRDPHTEGSNKQTLTSGPKIGTCWI